MLKLFPLIDLPPVKNLLFKKYDNKPGDQLVPTLCVGTGKPGKTRGSHAERGNQGTRDDA
jgi:hypothetical protein